MLDDGNRPRLRETAASYGSSYITRSDDAHYDAGNLSDGIASTRQRDVSLEFRAIVHADFVPGPEFIRTPLAVPTDGALGIVQTPQCIYNPDPHQAAFGGLRNWPHERRSWFDGYVPAFDARAFPTRLVYEDTLARMKTQSSRSSSRPEKRK